MQNLTGSRTTDYDDEYATCERTLARFSIYSGEKPPEEITLTLELAPTHQCEIGQVRTNSIGRTRTDSLNAWFLSSEGFISSRELRRHLDWLLENLVTRSTQIAKLQKTSGIKMRVDCIWWSAFGQGGPTLWPEQMNIMAKLNLECAFDVSFYGLQEGDVRKTIS